jgi:hypothetical protein
MSVLDDLSKFIDTERDRFEERHNNMFTFAVSEIGRYRRYLDVISARHEKASSEFVANSRAVFETTTDDAKSTHSGLFALFERGRVLSDGMHMEIESFYLFAKILLDKVARAVEFYFGQARGMSLDSHDDFTKHFEGFAARKGLAQDPGIIQQLCELKELISDFRDYQIAHEKSPRTTRGTAFAGGKVWMVQNQLYPSSKDKQVESVPIENLLSAIDSYVASLIRFIGVNRERTALKCR